MIKDLSAYIKNITVICAQDARLEPLLQVGLVVETRHNDAEEDN